jgi:spermidine synthase
MLWYFLFFFLSGFCSVLYELVWLRLTMAQFGVTTAMVSIVLSVFMAGLGLGSWASGKWFSRGGANSAFPALRLYGMIELLIGVSGIVVPTILMAGHRLLESYGPSGSFGFYVVAGLWVAITLIPWCALMGATVPVGMRAIAQTLSRESSRSFSYLYLANVAGAVAGTAIPLFLVEFLGFRGTLFVGVAANVVIASSAWLLARGYRALPGAELQPSSPTAISMGDRSLLTLLFLTGLTSMGMEVVWVRRFTPFLGTVVYAFASILAVYLLATVAGAAFYRRWSSRGRPHSPAIWSILAAFALVPLVTASPDVDLTNAARLLFGLPLFTGFLGFITPMLVDRYSKGSPVEAGRAYAINIVGCILGALLAGFCMLPFMSERWALIILTLPWLILGIAPLFSAGQTGVPGRIVICASLLVAALLAFYGGGDDENLTQGKLLRDSTATVIATGTGRQKQLLINGYGITSLTPITKVMAHLPLAFLDRPPQSALVICFGMGTTFRALHSWGIPVTVVELVPSVPRMFGYFHHDGDQILSSPLAHVVVDDGRRFLERTTDQFDVITIDPPPPLQAAGSSLLYSKEFYQVAKRRLRPGGILQQWLPADEEDVVVVSSISRSIRDSYRYVRSFWDEFGIHFLCSDSPIPDRNAADLLRRLPASAVTDFVEWSVPKSAAPNSLAEAQFQNLLENETQIDEFIAKAPNAPALTDNRPVNEYSLFRDWRGKEQKTVSPLE